MPRPQLVEQMGFDEKVITDAPLEEALEQRQTEKVALSERRKAYKQAHEAAGKGIERLELPEGHAVRIGRFRITRTAIAARSVSFDTEARSQVSIAVVGED